MIKFRWVHKRVLDLFVLISSPASWMHRGTEYNEDVNEFVSRALRNPVFESDSSDGCTIMLNGVDFWCENAPYCCAHPYGAEAEKLIGVGGPSRVNMIRFDRALKSFRRGEIKQQTWDKEREKRKEISEEYFNGISIENVQKACRKIYPENFI